MKKVLKDCLVSKQEWPLLVRELSRREPQVTWSGRRPLKSFNPWKDLAFAENKPVLLLKSTTGRPMWYWGDPANEPDRLQKRPGRMKDWVDAKKILRSVPAQMREFEF